MAQGTVASTTQPEAPQQPAEVAYEQEIRFAVVMYGGVSLAIYINGVAQELLNLVRATAPARPTRLDPDEAMLSDAEIEGTTAEVYRELGRLLHRRDKSASSAGNGRPIRTRFVVDVLSGSSAGGLNGIYLAKALVNDQPIEALKQLWVDEADIAKIVNDDKSYGELGFARRRPPESALNSRRMYAKLLEALDGMDRARDPRDETFESPYVDELDLWITTTDVRGVTVPIDTFDRFVFEKRHRKVFRFVYGSAHARGELEPGAPGTIRSERSRNDFLKRNNPFLAFAGRCTSAFPFAFEPMQLNDIDQVLSSRSLPQRVPGSQGRQHGLAALVRGVPEAWRERGGRGRRGGRAGRGLSHPVVRRRRLPRQQAVYLGDAVARPETGRSPGRPATHLHRARSRRRRPAHAHRPGSRATSSRPGRRTARWRTSTRRRPACGRTRSRTRWRRSPASRGRSRSATTSRTSCAGTGSSSASTTSARSWTSRRP